MAQERKESLKIVTLAVFNDGRGNFNFNLTVSV